MKQYKLHLFILGTILSCTSCSTSYYSHYNRAFVSNIPFPAHENKVEFITPGQQLNPNDYVKVGIFESVGGEGTMQESHVEELMRIAQERGADAIILLNFQNRVTGINETVNVGSILGTAIGNAIFKTNETPPKEYVTQSQTTASALGIKYVKNISYLDKYVKTIDLQEYDPQTEKYNLANTLSLTPTGYVTKQTNPDNYLYNHFVKNYTESTLLYEQTKDWSFQVENGRITKRLLSDKDGYSIKEIKIKHHPWGAISRITIANNPYNEEYNVDKIDYIYQDGQLIKRKIVTKDKQTVLENYIYDAASYKLLEIRGSQLTESGERPIYIQKLSYYSNSDLPELLK